MAMACDSECEIEMLISFTPAFFAAAAASPWSWNMLVDVQLE